MKYIFKFLFIFITNLAFCQNNDSDFNKELRDVNIIIGTWKDSIPFPQGFVVPQGVIMITADSILIKRRIPGHSSYTQLLKYKIIDDTIFAKEIKFISIDENEGFAHSYFKNRKLNTTIPLCHFFNSCFAEKADRTTNPRYMSLCIKQSNQTDIADQFNQALAMYKKCKGKK